MKRLGAYCTPQGPLKSDSQAIPSIQLGSVAWWSPRWTEPRYLNANEAMISARRVRDDQRQAASSPQAR